MGLGAVLCSTTACGRFAIKSGAARAHWTGAVGSFGLKIRCSDSRACDLPFRVWFGLSQRFDDLRQTIGTVHVTIDLHLSIKGSAGAGEERRVMGWRDVIGAVLDATAAAPARQNLISNQQGAGNGLRRQGSLARPRPATPASPEPERPALQNLHEAPAVFDHIEWRCFEAVCEALFAQSGMRSESQSYGADGGVDTWLYSQHSDEPVIVQCKHWKKRAAAKRSRASSMAC